ncbi:hypothetical protein GCM10009834_11140 [Streptomonospora arabica]
MPFGDKATESAAEAYRGVLSEEVLNAAYEMLDKCIDNNFGGLTQLASFANQAAWSLQANDRPASLVFSWSVCEAVISEKWEHYLRRERRNPGFEPPNRERRNRLTRQNVSTVTEFLNLADVIDNNTLDRLEAARNTRNRWIHQRRNPSRGSCHESIDLACVLISEYLGPSVLVAVGD